MQLIADICDVHVILPHSPSAAVVLGSAMLGRFAAEVSMLGQVPSDKDQRQRLWRIMVHSMQIFQWNEADSAFLQVEMTQPGELVQPSVRPRQKRLLEAKYKIFRETIEIQRRWRKEIEEVLSGEY